MSLQKFFNILYRNSLNSVFFWRTVWAFLSQIMCLFLMPCYMSMSLVKDYESPPWSFEKDPRFNNKWNTLFFLWWLTGIFQREITHLTFVNSRYQKLVISYRVDTCILHSIKLHFLWWTGYLSLNSWLANQPLSRVTICLEHKTYFKYKRNLRMLV